MSNHVATAVVSSQLLTTWPDKITLQATENCPVRFHTTISDSDAESDLGLAGFVKRLFTINHSVIYHTWRKCIRRRFGAHINCSRQGKRIVTQDREVNGYKYIIFPGLRSRLKFIRHDKGFARFSEESGMESAGVRINNSRVPESRFTTACLVHMRYDSTVFVHAVRSDQTTR
ncbi:hypothetical protein T310_7564 [Rasamsonia emersonii CBS 393.64]|uniref:Uncharacterized protein n=1 Tax=Rasamsonia emersonii (strain ATCC 16479 / CBS 393.64 / IMI 116815) TaxID=1408163 RepID=A0A0F4YJL9_RASE3|nr:hypothetical protein T310_7564 [Rasamsonia emersonii CBS 393.64]KKA18487.1 hypothetical protein T310_7564 [Rasamsonia emersonii CBS 393.64]